MGSFTFGTGKGLREPVSPYRMANVFGAELNTPDADGWNAVPVLTEPTTSFNLAGMEPGHEVVVAVMGATNTLAGLYNVTLQWFRVRDNKLLYDYRFSRNQESGQWLYAYSYIGYVSWEIYENGEYDVKVIVTGPETFTRAIRVNVSGIVVLPELPVVAGNFIQGITARLASAAEFFYAAWMEVGSWIWPFNLLAAPLYGLGQAFDWLVVHFIDFGIWVNTVAARIDDILSPSDILALVRTWLDYAESSWSWISNAWQNVTGIIDSWWSGRLLEVLAWIDQAKGEALSYVNNMSILVGNLTAAWEDFRGRIPALDQVVSWWSNFPGNILLVVYDWWGKQLLEVQSLVDSAFLARDRLWSGWQELRDQVVEFFSDPEEWVYDRLDSFFERFW